MNKIKKLTADLILPIKILVIGVMFSAISVILQTGDTPTNYSLLQKLADLFGYAGAFIYQAFPVIVLIRFLNRRYNDNFSMILGFISYIVLHVTTMIFAPTTLPSYAYSSVLGINVSYNISATQVFTRTPLQLGLIGTVVAYFLTRFVIDNYRRRGYGRFNFIEKEVLNILYIFVFTVCAGIVVSYSWGYFIHMINAIRDFIATDITNPFRVMVYSVVEKILDLLWIPNLIRTPFLHESIGGSYVDAYSQKYIGDLAVWSAMLNLDIVIKGVGRFITTRYLTAIFLIPGFMWGSITAVTNKKERHKMALFYLFLTAIVMTTGYTWPLEIFLLVNTPMLFGIYLVGIATSALTTTAFQSTLGYELIGDKLLATPGNIFDLIRYGGDGTLETQVYIVVIIGIVLAFFAFLFARHYLRHSKISSKSVVVVDCDIAGLIAALGGINNINEVDAFASKLNVKVENRRNVDIQAIKDVGASGIVENRNGFTLIFGHQSTLIRGEILNYKANYQKTESIDIKVNK